MKKALVIILWMLLGAFTLVLIAGGAFGFFVYKHVKANVMDFTCADYTKNSEDLVGLLNKPDSEATIEDKMKPVGIITNLMGYVIIRENGDLPEDFMENKEKLVRYNDELLSICRKYPQVQMFDLAKGVENKVVPPEVKKQVDDMLASVTVTHDERSSIYMSLIAQALADRAKIAKEAETRISATLVSTTATVSESK